MNVPDGARLPRWARRDAWQADAGGLVERYAPMSDSERFEHIRAACDLAMEIACSRPDRDEVLARRVALPKSSEDHLARLRATHRLNG